MIEIWNLQKKSIVDIPLSQPCEIIPKNLQSKIVLMLHVALASRRGLPYQSLPIPTIATWAWQVRRELEFLCRIVWQWLLLRTAPQSINFLLATTSIILTMDAAYSKKTDHVQAAHRRHSFPGEIRWYRWGKPGLLHKGTADCDWTNDRGIASMCLQILAWE